MSWRIRSSLPVCMLFVFLGSIACATQAGGSAPSSSTVSSMESDIGQTGSALVAGVEFERGQASWTSASIGTLEQVLIVLQRHTEWRFEVQVHTDELNDRAADQALTERRAEAIAAWLSARGIDSTRLVPRGFGSSRPRHEPVASSTANRWVELKKLNEE
jgi:outer membrane protein OmpA-like peptidoglycan-associated protein